MDNSQTPTPRRFLTKRPASSQLPHSTPTPMRFQSTPRFGSTQSVTRQMEDVEEVDVGASQSQSNANERPCSEGRDIASDSIEVDSCANSLTSREERRGSSSSSSSSEHEMDEDGDARRPRGYVSDGNKVEENGVAMDVHAELIYGDDGTPPVKRRRLSASASPTELHMVVAAYDSDTGHHHEQDDSEQDYEEHDVQDKTRTRVPAQQPIFQRAPRFKPAPEDEPFAPGQAGTAAADALLAAPFSPPRRGAKYLAGGLA
ncbi:hypothetical protein MY11210_005890 [Beauveria gryllotalpidicola]